MSNPIQTSGRVEERGGMHFYEQDIVMLGYLYTDDITIDFDMTYTMPGFGIVLSAYNKWAGKTASDTKLLVAKIGTMEFSVYEKVLGQQKCVHVETNTFQPDGKPHKLRFVKAGSYLHVFDASEQDKELLGKCNIGDAYDRFQVGIYSNQGNTIQDMTVNDSRPSVWGTSIKNTNGGRVSFYQDGFKVENAENAIEVIREDVPLEPGRYFFSYKTSSEDDEPANVQAFVFPSKEPRIKAREKNLLQKDPKHYGDHEFFDIAEDTHITILFEAYSGSVYDVAIKLDASQDYVSTNGQTNERGGSFLQLNLRNLKEVCWTGTINSVPYSAIDKQPKYSLFKYGDHIVTVDSAKVNLGEAYQYELKLAGGIWILRIFHHEKEVHYSGYTIGEDTAFIFTNVSGKIDKITIVDKNDQKRDVLYQRTIKKFVPQSIASPIIVTGKGDELPFDLSASYRILPDGKYLFTNWEREIFRPTRTMTLAKQLYGSTDIVLYGIRGEYDLEKLYEIPKEELVNNIDAVTEQYDEITNDNYEVRNDQMIVLSDNLDRTAYRLFIVDYLKNDSYAVNSETRGEYELDISTEKEDVDTYYDVSESGEIHSYKLLDMGTPKDDSYIVLRRNEVTA